MAEVQGIQGDSGGRRSLTPEQIERKKALGIPVHLTEDECHYVDGFCRCGAKKPGIKFGQGTAYPRRGTSGKPGLDWIEKNWEEYH